MKNTGDKPADNPRCYEYVDHNANLWVLTVRFVVGIFVALFYIYLVMSVGNKDIKLSDKEVPPPA